MINRKKAMDIIKALGFTLRYKGSDTYESVIDGIHIYIYYYQSKPKGWTIQIGHAGSSLTVYRKLNKMSDMLTAVAEYYRNAAQKAERDEFRGMVSELNNKIKY